MKKIHILYQDKNQIFNNCFIHQLYKTLYFGYSQISHISLNDLKKGNLNILKKNDKILILLKLRDWRINIPFIAKYFNKSQIFFYDQDPWEAYHDNCVARDVYKQVYDMINVKKFLITSSWWCDYIKKKENIPTEFVRMGILPSLCDLGPSYSKREHNLGFQGSINNYREDFFKRLKKKEIYVKVFPRVQFIEFLKQIQNIKIFIYNQHNSMTINKRKHSTQGLWGKCMTVAGRGCLVLRDFDDAAKTYNIDELPSVFTFKNENEIPKIIKMINTFSLEKIDDIRQKTVKKLKSRNDWNSIIEALESD